MFIFVLYDSQRKDLYNIGLVANPNPNFDIDNKKLKVKYVLLINDQKNLFNLYADSLKQYKKNDTNYEIPDRSVILQNMESILGKTEYNNVRKNLRTDKDFFAVITSTPAPVSVQKPTEQKSIFGMIPKFFNIQISDPKPDQETLPAPVSEPMNVPISEPKIEANLDEIEADFEIMEIEQDQKNGELVPMENPVTLEPMPELKQESVPMPELKQESEMTSVPTQDSRKLELFRFLVQENPKKPEPVKKEESQEPEVAETTPKIQDPEIRESHLDL